LFWFPSLAKLVISKTTIQATDRATTDKGKKRRQQLLRKATTRPTEQPT
jgi:hypothetical protein